MLGDQATSRTQSEWPSRVWVTEYVLDSGLSLQVSNPTRNKQNRKNILVIPNLDQIVAPTGNKAALLAGPRSGANQAARRGGGRPADGVDAHAVGVEDLVCPAVVAELEDANVAVGRGAGQEAAALVRRPGDHVDGGCVEGEIEDLGPGAAAGGGRCVLVLLAPDEDLAIVGGGGEDGAEFGVCLGEESVMAIEKWEGGTG